MYDKRTVYTQEKPSTSGYIKIQNDPPKALPIMVEDEAPTPAGDKRNKATHKGL